MQLPATLRMFWPSVTSMASRVWRWARRVAAMEMFMDSMNRVPPMSVRKGRAYSMRPCGSCMTCSIGSARK